MMLEEIERTEVMDVEEFEVELILSYNTEMNEFWKEQYQMFISGYRGVMLLPATIEILGET